MAQNQANRGAADSPDYENIYSCNINGRLTKTKTS